MHSDVLSLAWLKMSFTTVETWVFCSLQLISEPLGNLWVTFLSMGVRSLHKMESKYWMRFTHKSCDFTSWTFKKSPDFTIPIIRLWGMVTLRIWKDYFSVLSPLTLSSGVFLPFHVTLFFRVMYILYVLYIGKSRFQGTPLSPGPFSAALNKGQDSLPCSPSFPALSIQFQRPVESSPLFPPSAINCLSLMLCSSLIAPHTPPLQGQTLGRTCTPLKPSIAG